MKAFSESPRALARRAGLILLFDGEVGSRSRTGVPPGEPRRAPPSRYPDFGPRTSLPPSRSHPRPVAVGVCSPLQWRNRPRFSRGSLTFGSVGDGQSVHLFQRTATSYAFTQLLPRRIFKPIARQLSKQIRGHTTEGATWKSVWRQRCFRCSRYPCRSRCGDTGPPPGRCVHRSRGKSFSIPSGPRPLGCKNRLW